MEKITLSSEAFIKFIQMLNKKPSKNEKLQNAIKMHKEKVIVDDNKKKQMMNDNIEFIDE